MNRPLSSAPEKKTLSLTGQVIRGAIWNVVGIWGRTGIQLLSTIIIARMLLPEDFALAGLANTIMGMFNIFVAQGFGNVLVQRKELESITCHSIFWFLVLMGIITGCAIMFATPLMVKFYRNNLLTNVMGIMALGYVISMLGSVPNALLQRSMNFRGINLITIIGAFLSAILGIGMAWQGYGYWALILPGIAASLFALPLVFWISGYKPKWEFEWKEIKRSSNFGLSVAASSFLGVIANNSDYLVMGRFWRKADFGQYYFAFERSRQPSQILTMQLGGVLLPAFSHVQDDLKRLRNGFLKGTYNVCLLILPTHTFLIAVADPLIPWLFGEQWRPSVPLFQVFLGYLLLASPSSLASDVVTALNRPQFGLYLNILRISLTIPALLYLGTHGFGILSTSIILMCIWFVLLPIWMSYAYRLMRLDWKEGINNVRYLFLVCLAGLPLVIFAKQMMLKSGFPVWVMLLVTVVFSSAAYVYLMRRSFSQLIGQIRNIAVT